MKLSKIMLTVLSLIGAENGAVPQRKGESSFLIRQAGSTVCINGNLADSRSTVKNILPTGFYGNHPDQGVLQVGGRAGNPFGKAVPEMHLPESGRYVLSFRFEEGITDLDEARYLGRVGYILTVRIGGDLVEEKILSNESRLDAFLQKGPTGNYTCPERGQEDPFSFLMYDAKKNVFTITFDYETEWTFVSCELFYSDVPAKIENVSLYKNVYPQEEIYAAKYDGVSCLGDYTENVGSNPVYDMTSQYGTVYSRDFLVQSFLAKDDCFPEGIHPTIEDPDDYFKKGKRADVGTRFVVFLKAQDFYGNASRVTLNITVADTRAPNIVMLHGDKIETSYATDFDNDEFIDENFVISDNYDKNPKFKIQLEDGGEIPQDRIGSWNAIILVEDTFGNRTAKTFELRLFDDVPPVITSQGDELVLGRKTKYSREKLLSLFSAEDAIDGHVDVIVVEDTYLNHEEEVGEYVFRVKAEDRSGNVSEKEMTIRVEDKEGPLFYVKETFLTVVEGEVPSLDDIVDALIRQQIIDNKVYVQKEVVEGEEINDRLKAGTYQVRLRLVDEEGEEESVLLTIEVVKKEAMEDVSSGTMTFWQRFIQFWVDLWYKIVAFFTGKD